MRLETRRTNRAGLDLLKGSLGEQLFYVGGPALWEGMTADRLLVATTSQIISFNCDLVELEFEGFSDEYNIVTISQASSADVELAQINGYTYSQFAGEVISDISIVEEVIAEFSGITCRWKFLSEVAWVFKLETGHMVITKLNHHMETLKVDFLNNLDALKLFPTEHRFEADKNCRIEISRKTFSLDSECDKFD